jgi:hypothetical protein
MIPCSLGTLGLAVFLVIPSDTKQTPDERVVTALFLVTNDRNEPMSEAEFARFKRTQVAILKSPVIAGEVMKQAPIVDLGVAKNESDPGAWLEKKLQVDFPHDGDLLRISLAGKRPDELRAILDAVATTYLDRFRQADQVIIERRVAVVEKFLTTYQEAITAKQKELTALSQALTGDSKDRRAYEQTRRDTEQELRRVRLERAAVEARLEHKKSSKNEAGVEQLQEDRAVLMAQEKMLIDALEAERKAWQPRVEAEELEKGLAQDEQSARKLSDEIKYLRGRLGRPVAVRLIYPTTVSRPK